MVDMYKQLCREEIDFAVIGEDKAFEWGLIGGVQIVDRWQNLQNCSFNLGFPKYKRVPKNMAELKQILGSGRIATSYPETLLWVH